MPIPVIVIVGPTASGKTAWAVRLAQKLHTEIVSADSMQIYQYMNIGTAKPTLEEQGGVVHHLLDFVPPWQPFSVADYAALAHQTLRNIHERGMVPILVGGTGLYIRAVLENLDFSQGESDPEYRAALQKRAEKEGGEGLHQLLSQQDPLSAERIHPNDIKRVIRALEVMHVTGMPMSVYQEQAKRAPSCYCAKKFGLYYEREKLYDRINQRVEKMIEQGLEREVRSLLEFPVEHTTAMQGIGYKEMVQYIQGDCSLAEAMASIQQNSRRYAKRQMTFFRADPHITWLDVTNGSEKALIQLEEELT